MNYATFVRLARTMGRHGFLFRKSAEVIGLLLKKQPPPKPKAGPNAAKSQALNKPVASS
jgi:hypothetical protein